jgi:hypothetical protein
VLDGVFVFLDQIGIAGDSLDGDFDFHNPMIQKTAQRGAVLFLAGLVLRF